MAKIDTIFKRIEAQAKVLAQKLFKRYTQQAVTDVKDFLEKSREDLQRWIGELAKGEIDKQEFESLVHAQTDLAEMHALKQAGLAAAQIDLFVNGFLDIVVSAAFEVIP